MYNIILTPPGANGSSRYPQARRELVMEGGALLQRKQT